MTPPSDAGPWTPDRSRYAYAEELSRYGWAWEFLRRNPAFRRDALAHRDRERRARDPSVVSCVRDDGARWHVARRRVPEAERWGLEHFPDPDRTGREVAAFWRSDLIAGELEAFLAPRRGVDDGLVPLAALPGKTAAFIRPGERVRLLVDDAGYCEMLAAAAPARAPRGDEEIALSMGGFGTFETRRERIGAFVARCRGAGAAAPRGCASAAQRLADVLVALDGKRDGRSYREIAHAFHDADEIAEDWAGPGAIKLRMRRLAARGEALVEGGYSALLAQPRERRR